MNEKLIIKNLQEKDILLGIKLDLGSEPLFEGSQERYTKGLDDLDTRAAKFYSKGARFAKWRCILRYCPSNLSIESVSHTLARYAMICQKNGLVPIVEPELIPDGTHSIEDCAAISRKIFKRVFSYLEDYGVILEGCLFKPHMIR